MKPTFLIHDTINNKTWWIDSDRSIWLSLNFPENDGMFLMKDQLIFKNYRPK